MTMVMTTEQVWEEFHPRLKQFILKRIPDEQNAEDILQEVFLKFIPTLLPCAIKRSCKVGSTRSPDEYRQALLLTEYKGLTQRELAERLGLSFSGAKSRVQRAREKLKAMLLDCCHFEFDRLGKVIDYQPKCACCRDRECGSGCT
jgi:RNA polymerase sigma-70 factor, ECF subfamily